MEMKKLKKLSREDLIELLLEETKRNEELEAKLNERVIKLEKAGSIAEAALSLNNVFEDAQKAADEYIAGIKNIYEEANEQLAKIKRHANNKGVVESEKQEEE